MAMSLLARLRQVRREIRHTYETVCALAQQPVPQRIAPDAPQTWVPPGHFYSPIVDTAELAARRAAVFDRSRPPAGVAMNVEGQLALIGRLAAHYPKLPFAEQVQPGLRYCYENGAYSYGDAILLACLLIDLRPRRLVEFGSGYSSCVTLDVNDRFLDGSMDCTFIDPYPELLQSLHGGMGAGCRVVKSMAQDIDLAIIDALEPGDVLFIDSTHVVKTGSDVHFHLFTVLPRVKPGVYIHFHDIFYPFEYPEAWLFQENRSWNELYALHALLMDNPKYEIVLFNDYLGREQAACMAAAMPLFMRNPGGGLWLLKR